MDASKKSYFTVHYIYWCYNSIHKSTVCMILNSNRWGNIFVLSIEQGIICWFAYSMLSSHGYNSKMTWCKNFPTTCYYFYTYRFVIYILNVISSVISHNKLQLWLIKREKGTWLQVILSPSETCFKLSSCQISNALKEVKLMPPNDFIVHIVM